MGLRKGQCNNLNGRPKGVPNKATTKIKDAMLEVFERLGGVEAMTIWAMEEKNKTDFYKMITKLLPIQVGNVEDEEFKTKELIEIKFIESNEG